MLVGATVEHVGFDASVTVAGRSMDADKVFTALVRFQRAYRDRTVAIPLYRYADVYLANPKLANFTGNASDMGPLWNVQHWWFQP